MNENHPIWGDNIQMSPKQMKLINENRNEIILKGFGTDEFGNSFADYGLTLHKKNNYINQITLHFHDRDIDIIYKKLNPTQSKSNDKNYVREIEREFFKGVEAVNNSETKLSVVHFKNALALMHEYGTLNKEWGSSCCFNIGEGLKHLGEFDQAIIYFNMSIEINRLNEDAYIGIGDCYLALENDDFLIHVDEILTECIKYFPNNEIAHLNRGIALFKLNRYKEAYNSFINASNLGNIEAKIYITEIKNYL